MSLLEDCWKIAVFGSFEHFENASKSTENITKET